MDARDFSPTHQETTEFLDKLRKEEDTDAEIQMVTIEKLRRVARIVNEIPNSRTRVIIRRYYGFEGAPETYQEIGDRLGLSRERIRQIIEAELEVLRREIAI
jgi:RNA polymerase sigma factor (sigma-70 family)